MSGSGGIPGYELAREAAERYGVTDSQVRRYCSQGRIPGAIKVGKTWFVPEDSWPDEAGFGRPQTWASPK